MKNEEIINEMFEEDEEMFEADFEENKIDTNSKAYKVGQMIGKVTNSRAFKIGTKIVEAAAAGAVLIYAYKKGYDDGVDSVNAIEPSTFEEELQYLEELNSGEESKTEQ